MSMSRLSRRADDPCPPEYHKTEKLKPSRSIDATRTARR
jgi:hypothetical protein